MTPEEFRANELAMKAFGLLPPRLQPAGGPGPGLLRGGRRLLRPQDQDDAPDRRAQEGARRSRGPARAALRQEGRLRQGREQDGDRPRADPCPGRPALRPRRHAKGRQEGRRSLAGALRLDRRRGDAGDVRRRHGRLGRRGDRQAARREPGVDVQPAVAVHAVHGRGQALRNAPADHQRVDDLSLTSKAWSSAPS